MSSRMSARAYYWIATQLELMKIKVVLDLQEDGGYTVYAPSLPGCISEGNTREEALHNIKEAIELYLEVEEADVAAVEGKEIAEVVL